MLQLKPNPLDQIAAEIPRRCRKRQFVKAILATRTAE